jgi:hypothetical protein
MALAFTFKGSEALEMLKTHFPKTWENEITEGQIFIKSMMHVHKLDAMAAYQKYLKYCGSTEKAVSTLAALYLMIQQSKIGDEIQQLQETQLQYGNQTTALEESKNTSSEDKKILREYYLSKQDELQNRIEELINSYPVIGEKALIIQTSLFDN